MSSKPKSGYQKRKIREEKQSTAAKISKRLTSFFPIEKPAQPQPQQGDDKPVQVGLASHIIEQSDLAETVTVPSSSSSPEPEACEKEKPAISVDSVHYDENRIILPDASDEQPNLSPFPSDRGLFAPKSIRQPDGTTRDFILLYGPCRPIISFPVGPCGRKFSKDYYTNTLSTGQQIQRKWLCYSPHLEKVYCETCWLFADRSGPYFRQEWIMGIDDWQHLSQKIGPHEDSSVHILAMRDRINYSKNKTIAAQLDAEILKDVDRWREVFKRIFRVILSLCTSNNPLRGHNEKLNALNPGNFLREIRLLAEFDPLLRELINDEKQKIKYLSKTIQNEVIQILSNSVRISICKDVRNVKYFSLILDSTTDITKVEQVSLVLRYCSFDDENKCVEIHESFLGFYELNDRSASGYERFIINALNDLKLDFSSCRGQGYDGASVMSGANRGLQANLLRKNEAAPFIHCLCHKLNLVLVDSAKSHAVMSDFFQTLQEIYVFFHSSGIRWNELDIIRKESKAPSNQKYHPTLKSLSETRWEARHSAVFALKQRYVHVLKSLTKIILTSKNRNEIAEANGIKRKLESFQFITLLVFWEKVLTAFHVLSKKLQTLNLTMGGCVTLWKNGIASLEALKMDLSIIKVEAIETAKSWGITPVRVSERLIRRTRFHDGMGIDTARRSTLNENDFEKLLPQVLEAIISQMMLRFQSTDNIFQTFTFLLPSVFLTCPEKELSDKVKKFCTIYKADIDTSLLTELVKLKACLQEELKKVDTVRDLINLLIEYDMRDSFPNLTIACLLFLTLPITTASAERSFSTLKIIKNYLRNSISEDRLSNMAVLSIESRRAQTLDTNEQIDIFANSKARRKPI